MIIEPKYQENCLMFFQGPVSVNLISYLGSYMQTFLPQDSKLLQRIFRVFVELTQNVSYYSDEIKEGKSGVYCGSGWISIQESNNHIRMSTGNQIKSDDGQKLTAYCKEINTLSDDELRKLKRDIRANALMRDINAQVGLIQIGIISSNDLEFQITKIDELHSFFIVSASLDKS